MGTNQVDGGKPASELGNPDETARLRSEVEELKQKLDKAKSRKAKGGKVRRTIAAILVVLACISFPVAITAGWTKRTLFQTDRWVATVAPMIEHRSVTDALSRRLTEEIMTLVDARALIAEALPPRAVLLAGPMTSAIQDSVEDRVAELLATDRFQELWVNAQRFTHAQLVAVLRGSGEVVTSEDGKVVLNLVPVINEVLLRIEARGEELFNKDVDLPEISSGEVPEVAREKLEDALGITVPPDLGEIVIYESDKLEAAQDAVKLFDRGVFVFGLIALALIAGALWVSKNRRRTLIVLSVGILLVFIAIRRSVMYVQDEVVDIARPENRGAARAIVEDLMRGYFSLTLTVMFVILAALALSLVTGPYPWAQRLRARASALGRSIAGSAREGPSDETTEWVRSHRDALRLGGALLGIVVLLLFDPSLIGTLLILAIVGAFELALMRMDPGGTEPTA